MTFIDFLLYISAGGSDFKYDIFLVDTETFFFFNICHFNFWNPINIPCLLHASYYLPSLYSDGHSTCMTPLSINLNSFFLQPRRSRSASPLILSPYRAIVFRPDAIFVLLRKAYKYSELGSVCRMVFISHPFNCLSLYMLSINSAQHHLEYSRVRHYFFIFFSVRIRIISCRHFLSSFLIP